LTAGVIAFGDGGFTEASLTASHAFLLNLTLDPGETAQMTFGFSQTNFVEYTPGLTSTVPEPSGFALLASGLGLSGLVARRRNGRRRAHLVSGPRVSVAKQDSIREEINDAIFD
jgi:hypothetical protein